MNGAPMLDNNKNFVSAMSLTALTNYCFKLCITPNTSDNSPLPGKRKLAMQYLNTENTPMREKEIACIHNCAL